jgi:hypothetical protein
MHKWKITYRRCMKVNHREEILDSLGRDEKAQRKCRASCKYHIVLVLGNLHCVYTKLLESEREQSSQSTEDHPVTRILQSIEKRWLNADQDLFIACFYLNPCINPPLRNRNNLPAAVLMGIIHRLYMRVFEAKECPGNLIPQILHYNGCTGPFSAELHRDERRYEGVGGTSSRHSIPDNCVFIHREYQHPPRRQPPTIIGDGVFIVDHPPPVFWPISDSLRNRIQSFI